MISAGRTSPAIALALLLQGQVNTTIAEGASEPARCATRFPKTYLVVDQSAALATADVYLSDECSGRLHGWADIERLTAQTIQQVGPAALASLAPLCVQLNSPCTPPFTGEDCVRIPPVFVRPIAMQSCPPRELPLQVAAPQSPGGVLRIPLADQNGNLQGCVPPRVSLDRQRRRYITGIRLAGCSANIIHPGATGSIAFGGASIELSDGFFDHKSFATPHVVTRLQGSIDASGRVHGLGFSLADLRRNWTHAYAVTVDLAPQTPRVER